MSTGIPRRRRFPMRPRDRSRLVRANFTGRAVQELPGLASAFGPLNMWVGRWSDDPEERVWTISEIRAALAARKDDQEHQ